MANEELHYVFQASYLNLVHCKFYDSQHVKRHAHLHWPLQLTTQLGKVIEGAPQSSSPANAAGPRVHNTDGMSPSADRQGRTTSDLLSWTDNSDASGGSLSGNASIPEDALDQPAFVDALAEGSNATELTSMQAAAEALLKAARHNQKTGRRKAIASRYMDGECIVISHQ